MWELIFLLKIELNYDIILINKIRTTFYEKIKTKIN